MHIAYKSIVFIQSSDETQEPERIREEDGVDALFEYLKQWETGEEAIEEGTTPPWGTSDEVWRFGEYIVTINSGLPYFGLIKVVTEVW